MTTLLPSGSEPGRPPKLTASAFAWAEAEAVAGVGFWELDVATGESTWSPGMFFLFGIDPAAEVTLDEVVQSRCHPEDAPRHDEALVRAFLYGEPYALDLRLMTGDGVRWVQARGRAVEDDYRRVIKLIGTLVDVTERKEAEMASGSARARLRQVVEQANCLLWQGDVYEIIPIHEWQGPVTDTVRGTALDWIVDVLNEADALRWLPIDIAAGEPFIDAWVRTRQIVGGREEGDRSIPALLSGADRYTQSIRTILKDGSVRWQMEDVRVEVLEPSVECCQTGEPLRRWRLTGVATDVTEQRLAEERLRALADDLARSNAALQEFAYVASHDLKEPLRKIETFGDLLRRQAGPYLGPEAHGYLDRMTGAANRMQGLIQALLEYSRVTTKPSPFEPVDLSAVAATVVSDLEVRIAEVGGTVAMSDLPTIVADPMQMRQLFQNLIANALKFRRDGVPPVVRVAADWGQDTLLLTFTDNGIGFAPEYAERIFSMFERLHSRSEYEGSGIGLAICRKIAERHGGTVTAEGRPGEGATFHVSFRVPRPASDSASAAFTL
jgi:signal transduction histidine kinase